MKNHIAEMTTAELMEIVGGGCEGGALKELLRRERERCLAAVQAEWDKIDAANFDRQDPYSDGLSLALSAIRGLR